MSWTWPDDSAPDPERKWLRDARIRLVNGRGAVHAAAIAEDGRAMRYCDSRWAEPGRWESADGSPLSCRSCLHEDARRALRGLPELDADEDEA